ncbi:MAG: dihydrolipoamide acetyltransferase family protein [Ignavibacteriales bacterium]|nr:dihydrolipoamide acetyltransferase family protein [Ignavibacteriales bacterium]
MATLIKMPKLSDTMEEGVILKWLRKEGEKIKQGDVLVEIQSDKADMELEAYDTGVVRKIFVPEGGKAPIGGLIAVIGGPDEDISAVLSGAPAVSAPKATDHSRQTAQAFTPSFQTTATAQSSGGRTKASPLARRLASEFKIDLSGVSGTGPQGRVVKRDLEGLLSDKRASVPTVPRPSVPGTFEEVELSLIRKTIAKRMIESKATAPHFYVTFEINMDPALTFRDQFNNGKETKLSFTDIVIKATSEALMKHPHVNATYLGDKMRQYHSIHIGVAVAMEEGLVTPIVRYCEKKSLEQINAELRDLVERARTRKLKPDEYLGATFTISNLGMFGVDEFAAIVNPPEGAILAVGGIVEKPVVKNGQIVIGHTMKITLSSDHRIIDGVVAARFMQDLKMILENPASLVL